MKEQLFSIPPVFIIPLVIIVIIVIALMYQLFCHVSEIISLARDRKSQESLKDIHFPVNPRPGYLHYDTKTRRFWRYTDDGLWKYVGRT